MKNLSHTLACLFQTDAHASRAAEKWADTYFPGPRREIARCVVLSVASALCVPVEDLKPETKLVEDLCADEKWEYEMIKLHIEDLLGKKFSEHSWFVSRTLHDLIELTATADLKK